MLTPISAAGQALHDRTADRFVRRIGGVSAGPLADADPDVLRAVLSATAPSAAPALDLTEWEWTVFASAAYGPGLADVSPETFRRVFLHHLIDPADPAALTAEEERLLVCKTLQAHDWSQVREVCDFPAAGPCMRSFGDACKPLVDLYGTDRAHSIRDRHAAENER
jgi:tRNA(Met) cytidine acetyltransferase